MNEFDVEVHFRSGRIDTFEKAEALPTGNFLIIFSSDKRTVYPLAEVIHYSVIKKV